MGMPYSPEGANIEHITNVSGNEIPSIVTPVSEWVKTLPKDTLSRFNIDSANFNDYKVLPRLLFGEYLSAQFKKLLDQSKELNIPVRVHYETAINDIRDVKNAVEIMNAEEWLTFDKVVVCTGHNWPKKHEGIVPGYFDSPYPPQKISKKFDHPICIKGSSLTAVDAVRSISRKNGEFQRKENGKLSFIKNDDATDFSLHLHTRKGFLPAVRFHLEDTHLRNDSLLTSDEVSTHIKENGGFLSLDYFFEKDFKSVFMEKDPAFYERIKFMTVEEFVEDMMKLREKLDAFQLLKAEYAEAEKSIERQQSIYWKEMLGVLSFAINYPAKYLSAEDMQRLQKSLLPLISLVIAYIPQSSAEELIALHDAGLLELISVGDASEVEISESGGVTYHYTTEEGTKVSTSFKTFIDCVGQPHLSYGDFPFESMLKDKTISPAKLRFSSANAAIQAISEGNSSVCLGSDGEYYLTVQGIAINDCFQVVDEYGAYNDRIYIMAVPYMGGYNPDYSGLDFCEAASLAIVKSLFPTHD